MENTRGNGVSTYHGSSHLPGYPPLFDYVHISLRITCSVAIDAIILLCTSEKFKCSVGKRMQTLRHIHGKQWNSLQISINLFNARYKQIVI